jgi:hypothetical protein
MFDFFIQGIDQLPLELLDMILEFTPVSSLLFLNHHFYDTFHSQCIRDVIPKAKFETYIRTMINQDNDFIVRHLLQENNSLWIRMTKYYYRACVYSNYIAFLEFYAEEMGSKKCQKMICDWQKVPIKTSHRKANRKIVEYIVWND